jgi:hypothetical protein
VQKKFKTREAEEKEKEVGDLWISRKKFQILGDNFEILGNNFRILGNNFQNIFLQDV